MLSDNELARLEAESDACRAFIADKVRDLMQPGGECYPFSPENVQEAIGEQNESVMAVIGNCLSEGMAVHDFLHTVVNDYWTRCAHVIASRASTLHFDGVDHDRTS